MRESIEELFPEHLREHWRTVSLRQEEITEIRIRALKPILVNVMGKEWYITKRGLLTAAKGEELSYDMEQIGEVINHVCRYSVYAYEEELKRGYLSVRGGHRIGITGQMGNEQTVMRNISSLNIRVAHQMKGVSDPYLQYLYARGKPQNCLLISPPGCGKTTMLRDLVRQISDGNRYARGITVGLVDERGELAGSYMGIPQNDVGMRTDVLEGCGKEEAILMLVRSMAPELIALDEMGELKEWNAVRKACACGVRVLATVHGDGLDDVSKRYELPEERIRLLFPVIFVLRREEMHFWMEQI